MSSENEETERDESDDEAIDEAGAPAPAPADDEAPDPNVPRNRAERRAAAKAARRGRSAVLADADAIAAQQAREADASGFVAPTTSMGGFGGGTGDVVPPLNTGRRKPPPRTMSKGTGDVEGIPDWARRLGSWFTNNRQTLVVGVLVGVALGGSITAWRTYTTRKENRAADAYAEAVNAYRGEVRSEDAPASESEPPRMVPRYHTHDERLRAAVEKFRQVEQQFPGSRVAPLARLDEASALFQLGRYQEARQLYRGLLGADTGGLEAPVREGLAFTLESLNDLDGAMAQYRELEQMQSGAYRDKSQFYQARLLMRRNEPARAKELLRAVAQRTAHPAATDPLATVTSALHDQALAILRDIDPTDPLVVERQRADQEAGGGHGHNANPMEGIPPELLEQLRRQVQQQQTKQGGSGAPPAGGAGGH